MIKVSKHTRLNPETAPLLIANVKSRLPLSSADSRLTLSSADTPVIYKGYAYAVQDEDVWTCYQGAVESSAYCKYADRTAAS